MLLDDLGPWPHGTELSTNTVASSERILGAPALKQEGNLRGRAMGANASKQAQAISEILSG